ncbi:N-6 DNA methylase [Synechococcus elongatus]|uniref:N-6 DNA methylase n=1 Tax=Synechococcus elongatus TaxID=32046 RepID=UPI0030D2A218
MSKSAVQESAQSILESGWKNFEGQLDPAASRVLILAMLLWASLSKTPVTGIIPYFDMSESLSATEQWQQVLEAIEQQFPSGLFVQSSRYWHALRAVSPEQLENLRLDLASAARLIKSTNPADHSFLVQALQEGLSNREADFLMTSLSPECQQLLAQIALSANEGSVACLLPIATSLTKVLVEQRSVVYSETLAEQTDPAAIGWHLALSHLIQGQGKLQTEAEQARPWPVVICCPPWGYRPSKEQNLAEEWLPIAESQCPEELRDLEAQLVFRAHECSSDTTIALVSTKLGFASALNVRLFREELIRRNWLEAVVELPNGAAQFSAVRSCLWVLKHKRPSDRPVLFVRADRYLETSDRRLNWDPQGIEQLIKLLQEPQGDQVRLVSHQAIQDSDYNLSVDRYFTQAELVKAKDKIAQMPTEPLKDLVELRRPVNFTRPKEGEAATGATVFEATPSDIDAAGYLVQPSKTWQATEDLESKLDSLQLQANDILIAVKASIGKVALVREQPPRLTIPGPSFCVARLRANAKISALALVQYLRSEVGQALLNHAAQGQSANASFLPMTELRDLAVVIPTPEQEAIALAIAEEITQYALEAKRIQEKLEAREAAAWLQ